MADTSREAHDVEMRSLVASFQNNINTISSLIVTLEKGYEYRQQVAEQLSDIREQTESLERYQEASNLKFGALTAELNSDAVRLFNVEIDRAGLSREENRRKLERFAAKINNAEAIRDIEDLLNPFCYFLRGLHHVATYQYESAISDLQIAHRKGKVDLVDSRLKNYAEQDKENLGALLQDMIVSCSHFQGVSLKNLGRYSEARDKFQEALDRNPLHRQSKTYLLQVMYFDPSFPFASIESEYEKAVEEFQNALTSAPSLDERKKLRKTFSVLRVNQGNMYLRKLIDLGVRPDHKQLENREKALRYYEEAYSYVEPYEDLSNYVAGFSVAQAMEDVGSSVWDEKSPLYFYREAMRSLRKRVAEDRDPLYSVLLYYMLAICADKLDEDGRSADVFLSQARHSLKEVPSDVTCFSPICKVRLHRSQILEEMDRFEEAFLRGGG
jgi:tetratricopeptide (TPR) repeat protein